MSIRTDHPGRKYFRPGDSMLPKSDLVAYMDTLMELSELTQLWMNRQLARRLQDAKLVP